MNAAKFDEIVRNQANTNVQRKIEAFRTTVAKAFSELYPFLNSYSWERAIAKGEKLAPSYPHSRASNEKFWTLADGATAILKSFTSEVPTTGWPAILWAEEEKAVAADILSKLDVVAQALVAKPMADTDSRPAQES